MSLIRKFNEIEIPKNIKMMIYGQAGMGKTTLALSTPNPLLIDFDEGVKRVSNEHLRSASVMQVEGKSDSERWRNVRSLLQNEKRTVMSYDTIVVDTIGKMMDMIIGFCCPGRNPQLKDWGKINAEFKWFCNELSGMGKNVIFVAHRNSRQEGDATVFMPALREKSYVSILTELDLLGYLEMQTEGGYQKRTITFDPTSRNEGKNTCHLPSVMTVPTLKPGDPNDYMTREVISRFVSVMEQKEKENKECSSQLEEGKQDMAMITDAQSANDFFKNVFPKYKSKGDFVIKAVKQMFRVKVTELGLVFDKETNEYKDKEEA